MIEQTDTDDFEEDESEDVIEDEEVIDIDHLIDDLETHRKSGLRSGDPAWRRLERYMEEKRTAEDISDFEDYDLDE